ncbi:MAG: hypothetical protein BZ136_08285, partial [Methanosphaera sp. rholeuAM74]
MISEVLTKHLKSIKEIKKPRPVVAYLTGNIHSDHPMGIVENLYELFGTQDVDVRFYIGTECIQFLEGVKLDESRFDYQYLSLYE